MAIFNVQPTEEQLEASRKKQNQTGVLAPMLSREPQGKINNTDPDNVAHISWLGVFTDDGLFNCSMQRNSDAADEARIEALALSDDPTQFGVEVEIKGNRVIYYGEVIGKRVTSDLSVVSLADPEAASVKLPLEMRRSEDVVVTNSSAGRNGVHMAHGEIFVNNFVEDCADVSNPRRMRNLTCYLRFLELFYPGNVDVEWGRMEMNIVPGDDSEQAKHARVLYKEMLESYNKMYSRRRNL